MNRNEEFKSIFDEYAVKAIRAQKKAEDLKKELHALSPELARIDGELSECGLRLFAESMRGGDDLQQRISAIRADNIRLKGEREALLKTLGLPADVTEPKYECSACRDSGYVGETMCDCLRTRLLLTRLENSGIGALVRKQTFDSFDPALQPATASEMKRIADKCRAFADSFDTSSENLLFIGKTGLGKTHLSTAIARRAIERGFDVVYDSSPNIFSDFETEQFKNGEKGMTDKYFLTDLLIVDDLGTELQSSFTLSVLYNLLNTRINRGKSTIVNTNLSAQELRRRYQHRITSRLFGEYLPLLFTGSDARQLKLKQNR